MSIRFNILPYAALRGLVPAKRVRGRLRLICGLWFWR